MQYFELFTPEYIDRTPVTGVVHSRDIDYLRRLYDFNINQIKLYYQSRNFAVKNTNLLARIIEHVPPHFNYGIFEYLDYLETKLRYIGKHFKFASDIEDGVIHYNQFFGGSEEIVINLEDTIDARRVTANWVNEPCIYLYTYTGNDTKLLLPLGKDDGRRSGLNVLGVDLRILAIKYREFVRQQMESDIRLGKNHFIIKYVLSLTTPDIVDHVLLNRVMDRFYGRDTVTPNFKHPFKLFEPDVQLDRYVDNTLDVIQNKKLDYVNVLHNIQLITRVDASELLVLPDLAGTKQSRWAMFVARLDYILFLYDIAKDRTMNKHYLNDWKRLADRIVRDNLIEGRFSYSTERSIKEKLQRVREF